MIRTNIILSAIILGNVASFASAATTYPGGGVYTVVGTVTNAAKPCPYAVKSALAGYTLFSVQSWTPYQGKPEVDFRKGPHLIFSPGGTAAKTDFDLKQVSFVGGSASAAGSLQVAYLPSTEIAKGSYKLTLSSVANKSFAAVLTVNFEAPSGTCKASYSLTFSKGLPANLYNLL